MAKSYKTISDSDLQDILLNPKLNRTGQYICDCPFCGKPGHFYINKKTQLFDCKKCGEVGNIFKILKLVGKTYLLEGSTVEYKKEITSIKEQIEESETEQITELPVVKLPVFWKVGGNEKYLKGRGLTDAEIERYNLGYTKFVSEFKGYVVIPVYDNGAVRGFLARYGSKEVPEDKLRWNNSRGTDFASLLFGFDEIEPETETVILVEGVFDKIKVDRVLNLYDSPEIKCCATFGKKISPQQRLKLKSRGVETIVLLYDFDALKEIKKYAIELSSEFDVKVTFTTNKDIDECTDQEALLVFDTFYSPSEICRNIIGFMR